MKTRAERTGEILNRSLALFNNATLEEIEVSREQALKFLQSTAAEDAPEDLTPDPIRPVPGRRWTLAVAIAAAVVAATVLIPRALPGSAAGTFRSADGVRRVEYGDLVRSAEGTGDLLVLSDGSRLEMRSGTELLLERADDGVRVRLSKGGVIVDAAKQRQGHLYLETRDVTVSVIGTVFLVSVEEEGSRVAVIQGEVTLKRGEVATTLLPGEQAASAQTMARIPVTEEIAWSRQAQEHVTLLQQLQEAAAPRHSTVVPDPPAFEVASVRPSVANNRNSMMDNRNERVRMENVSIQEIVQYAYSLRSYQISGPDLLNADRYTIEAKAPSGTPNSLLPAMVQQLLFKRFNMMLRQETKEVPVYALIIGKDRPKIKESDEAGSGGFVTGNRSGDERGYVPVKWRGNMSLFAVGLSGIVGDRPVVDRTGLTGHYFEEFSYVPDAALRQGAVGPSLFDAINELGLKLEPVRASLEFLIIEHVEKPSDN